MSAKAEVESGRLDSVKFALALVVAAAGVGAYYYYGDQSTLLRVLGVIASFAVAAAIALQTGKGRAAWLFAKEARTEVRKVVWPSRAETTQTTVIVIAVVIVMALLLWGFDAVLLWAVKILTGQGG